MTEELKVTQASEDQVAANRAAQHGYESWIRSLGIPVHEGYYLDDLRTIELGWWEERQCNAAFLQLEGQQGVAEARVTEIAPGQTLPPLKFALDDVVYVLEGRGFCTVSSDDGRSTRTFEWQKHSLFLLPRNYTHQLSNAQGDRPARLLHNNYLPVAMVGVPDPDFFFNNPSASGADRLVRRVLLGGESAQPAYRQWPRARAVDRQLLPGHALLGQARAVLRTRRRGHDGVHRVPRFADDVPHVGVRRGHVQEGPPPRARLRSS